ncbi:MAG: alpha/beta hydrolase [Bacillus sp. (in: Bacteria)]|nr:alpha/beta hydrolase [Bacillus sp. (in: firmicutes)]
MNKETFSFTGEDGVEIFARKWSPESEVEVKGVVQIAHGMAEHSERYDDFASFLVDEGFVVFANDHRGHGQTIKNKEDYGFFVEENGFETVVEDLHILTDHIGEEYPNVPIFLFGHSMGSFLVRRYIQRFDKGLQGVIISGTGGNPGIVGKLAKGIAKREINKLGKKGPSELLSKLVFGKHNKQFNPARTEYDWLSADEAVVDAYIKDPLCGGTCTAGFFLDLFEGLEAIHRKESMSKVRKDLPIFVFSGDKDPVGGNGKGVLQVYNSFKKVGLKDVECKLYPSGRHEMLNEVNKDEVFNDILKWMDGRLKNA